MWIVRLIFCCVTLNFTVHLVSKQTTQGYMPYTHELVIITKAGAFDIVMQFLYFFCLPWARNGTRIQNTLKVHQSNFGWSCHIVELLLFYIFWQTKWITTNVCSNEYYKIFIVTLWGNTSTHKYIYYDPNCHSNKHLW